MTIVSAALRLPPEKRRAFIHEAAGDDGRLLAEAQEAMQWEEDMGSFLQQPVFVLSTPGFEPGQVIAGRFEILRQIGEGAMGVVYEAFDRKRNVRIAIKSAKAGFRRQLEPELEGALRVRHPNICLVNEIHTAEAESGEVDFLTMELLEGETLNERLSNGGKLFISEAIDVARQLCAGVAEAHRCGVLHRDLKSSNVILCRNPDGSVRAVITDFGLSGLAEQDGGLWGTPRYIAPELWQGKDASESSDLYALGVILFEMAFGCAPSGYPGFTLESDVPRSYSRLLEGCLSLEPSKRVEAFEKALRHDYWNRSAWTRRNILAVGVTTIGLAAGAAWLDREEIIDFFKPLPRKRFVALFASSATTDPLAKAIVSGVIDAVESELSRAEAADPNLLVIAARNTSSVTSAPAPIRETCDSMGANLALEATGVSSAAKFSLFLALLDARTNAVLRRGRVICGPAEIPSLAGKAVRAAATLLNVRWTGTAAALAGPPTNSPRAFRAFQAAEEFRSRPNDDGLDQAIENYKAAIDADPQFALAYARLALAYSRLYGLRADSGALDLAEANATKALDLNRNLAEGHLALGYAFEKRGNEEKALGEIHRAIALDPANPRTLLWQAQVYARFKRWSDAERTYLQLKRERPNYWMAYNDVGYVFDQQGKYEKAIEAFRAATIAAPFSAIAFSNLGEILFKFGNFAEAKDNFEKSVALKPNGLGYSNLAEVLRLLGNYPEAIASSQHAVTLEPADDEHWLVLADSYDSLRGHEREAREAYARAATEVERRLRTDPTDGAAWIRLALYAQKRRSAHDVASIIRKAQRFGIGDLDSQIVKARVLELMGRRKEAVATLTDCFRNGMTFFEIASVPDFAALRVDPAFAQIQKAARDHVNK